MVSQGNHPCWLVTNREYASWSIDPDSGYIFALFGPKNDSFMLKEEETQAHPYVTLGEEALYLLKFLHALY